MLEGIANGSVLLRAKQCEVQPLCAVTSAVPLGRARHVPHAELREWRGWGGPSRACQPHGRTAKGSYLVDPASSHMLVSKIKPCMSKYERSSL